MPKKNWGENSKSAEARARKAAVKAEDRERKEKEAEDKLWEDNDKHVLRKQERKEDKERKEKERLQKKLEAQKKTFREHLKKVLKDERKPQVKLEFCENTKQWRPSRAEAKGKAQLLERSFFLKAGLLNAEDIDRTGKREEMTNMGGGKN